MPQVMKPERGEARPLPQLVPAAVDIARLDRCADGGGKHEPVLTPCLPQRKASRVLPLPVLAQVADGQPGQDNCPPGGARLRLHDPQLAVGALQGPAHPKLPRVQIDILPAQGEQLAAAQPGRERQDVEGFQPFALDGAEQPLGVLDGQVGAAVADQRWCLHLGSDIPRDELQPVGVGQCVADQLVDMLNGCCARRGAA
jgi:hypothetical protein